jgi:long-subunit acyl-CoA synthetase (AMP-forming)
VKRFTVLTEEWLPDSEELTPTMKLKRRGVLTKYAEEIEALYE